MARLMVCWLLVLVASAAIPLPPSQAPTLGTDDAAQRSPMPTVPGSLTRPTRSLAPTPTAAITPSPTAFQYFDKVQSFDGKFLGTKVYLSDCMNDCDGKVCDEIHASGCRDGRYLVVGDGLLGKVVVFKRPQIEMSSTGDAIDHQMEGQDYIPINSPGTATQQQLNWTCSTGDHLQVNVTVQGGVAMFIDRDSDVLSIGATHSPRITGDILAIGAPGNNFGKGEVNVYAYSTITHSFEYIQRIVPSAPKEGWAPNPIKLNIGNSVAMGNKVLAVGSADKYVFVYKYTLISGAYKYSLVSRLYACIQNPSAQTVTAPCNTIAVPQDGEKLFVASPYFNLPGQSASSTDTVNAGRLYVYTQPPAGGAWTTSQTLDVASDCSAGLAGPPIGLAGPPISNLDYGSCRFGQSIATTPTGDIVVVSAFCDVGAKLNGIIYTFYLSPTSTKNYECGGIVLASPAFQDGVTTFAYSLGVMREETGYYLFEGNPKYGRNKGEVRIYWASNPFSSDLPGPVGNGGGQQWDEAPDSYTDGADEDRMGYSVSAVKGTIAVSAPARTECLDGQCPPNPKTYARNVVVYGNVAPTGAPTSKPSSRPTQYQWPTVQPTEFQYLVAYVPAEVVGDELQISYTFDVPGGDYQHWYLTVSVLNTGGWGGAKAGSGQMSIATSVGGVSSLPLVLLDGRCSPGDNIGNGDGKQRVRRSRSASASNPAVNCSSIQPPKVHLRPREPYHEYRPPDSMFTTCFWNADVGASMVPATAFQPAQLRVLAGSIGMVLQPPDLPQCSFNNTPGGYIYLKMILSPTILNGAPQPPVRTVNTDELTVNNPLLTSGTSLFLCAIGAFLCASVGLVLHRSREAEETTVPLSLYPTIINLALLGNSWVAEVFLVYTADSAKAYTDVACVVIFGRLVHFGVSVFYMRRILGPEKWVDISAYNSLLNVSSFKHYVHLYGLVLWGSLMDVPLLRFLPWRLSQFSAQHDGWPDAAIMKVALWVKLGQSSLTLLTTFAFIGLISQSNPDLNGFSVFFLAYLVSSFGIMIVVYMREVVVRLWRPPKPLDDRTQQMIELLSANKGGEGSGGVQSLQMQKWAEGRFSEIDHAEHIINPLGINNSMLQENRKVAAAAVTQGVGVGVGAVPTTGRFKADKDKDGSGGGAGAGSLSPVLAAELERESFESSGVNPLSLSSGMRGRQSLSQNIGALAGLGGAGGGLASLLSPTRRQSLSNAGLAAGSGSGSGSASGSGSVSAGGAKASIGGGDSAAHVAADAAAASEATEMDNMDSLLEALMGSSSSSSSSPPLVDLDAGAGAGAGNDYGSRGSSASATVGRPSMSQTQPQPQGQGQAETAAAAALAVMPAGAPQPLPGMVGRGSDAEALVAAAAAELKHRPSITTTTLTAGAEAGAGAGEGARLSELSSPSKTTAEGQAPTPTPTTPATAVTLPPNAGPGTAPGAVGQGPVAPPGRGPPRQLAPRPLGPDGRPMMGSPRPGAGPGAGGPRAGPPIGPDGRPMAPRPRPVMLSPDGKPMTSPGPRPGPRPGVEGGGGGLISPGGGPPRAGPPLGPDGRPMAPRPRPMGPDGRPMMPRPRPLGPDGRPMMGSPGPGGPRPGPRPGGPGPGPALPPGALSGEPPATP